MYQYPKDEIVNIFPYDPAVNKLGLSIVDTLNKKLDDVIVHFFGSAALKIAGQRDVDIVIESKLESLKKHMEIISNLYGSPELIKKDFIKWSLRKNDCDVQLVLTDENSNLLYSQKMVFKALLENKGEYENLKLKMNGKTIYEYERVRKVFFNKILKCWLGVIFYKNEY